MIVAYIVVMAVLCAFAVVVFFGAPYVPTLSKQRRIALDLLDLEEGQKLLELGAGDGAMTIMALKRGLRVHAIEINPLLCAVIWLRTRKYRHHVTITCGNFWRVNLGECDGIYVFLLDRYMTKLDKLLVSRNRPVKLASFAFPIENRKEVKRLENVFLYKY